MKNKFKVGIVVPRSLAKTLFYDEDMAHLASFADFNTIDTLPDIITEEYMIKTLIGVDAAITGWGTPPFSETMLDQLPTLKFVAHSAGSIKNLVPRSFWDGNRRITSNAPIIAEDVAQTTLALILSGLKRLWLFEKETSDGKWVGGVANTIPMWRLDGLTVGIVGASLIGKKIAEMLQPFRCRILISDKYFSFLEAERMGIKLVQLEDMIRQSDVLTLHAPANPDCKHLLNAENIGLLKDGSLVINTARGMLIDENSFITRLREGKIFACLDVTDPEPPAPDHPFRSMRNVLLLPHIAGGHTVNGRRMMGQNMIIELFNYFQKGLVSFDICLDMLNRMA